MVSARLYVHWSDMTETVCKCISVEFASGSKIPLVGRWGVVFSSSRLYPKDNYHQASAWGMSEMAALPALIFSALNNGIIFIIYQLFQNLKWVGLGLLSGNVYTTTRKVNIKKKNCTHSRQPISHPYRWNIDHIEQFLWACHVWFVLSLCGLGVLFTYYYYK